MTLSSMDSSVPDSRFS
uniref:Uncharacterized protein n=1 Tax=Rhizophora mucronata TaxID=61149 RepID=A0A2P2ND33_RHIMU